MQRQIYMQRHLAFLHWIRDHTVDMNFSSDIKLNYHIADYMC